MAPDVPPTTQPVLKHWATWLQAAIYSYEHFELIKEFIADLEENAAAISKIQLLFSKINMKRNLMYLY